MRFTEKMIYNIKKALPVLAIAGAGLMASCDKDDEPDVPQHDVELGFCQDYYDEIQPTIVSKHAYDPSVRNIYFVVTNSYFTNYGPLGIGQFRRYLDERIQIAPNKIHGRGNFEFEPGIIAKEDSLWFVKQGWTVNQQAQKQK